MTLALTPSWSVCQSPTSPNPSLLDVRKIHEVGTPITTSSSPDSNSYISTGSPTLLNPEHDIRSSLGSSHSALTVKFAPLPQIDPNRKRSLVPLGVPARSRRKRVVQQEGGPSIWSTDPNVPEENMEDPFITFAKLVKKMGQMLWRRVRKGSKAVPQESRVLHSAELVLDINSSVSSGDAAPGDTSQGMPEVVSGEVKQKRRASWSPSGERGTLCSPDSKAKRRSTSGL